MGLLVVPVSGPERVVDVHVGQGRQGLRELVVPELLAGQLVRTIEKDDATQFMRWDLNNQALFPVASGIYIVHIDMPDIGISKVLKIAIVQEQEVLDSY